MVTMVPETRSSLVGQTTRLSSVTVSLTKSLGLAGLEVPCCGRLNHARRARRDATWPGSLP